jgi:class 3 adenylate cyclase/tetratricopeptide (TPR) repeat protein
MILLTDLVGWTRLAHALGPERAEKVREEHFALLRIAIDASGGKEIKNTGDGLMVAFSSASAAVRCAVSMQQLIERRSRTLDHPLHLRVGLGAGESTVKEGDYFGMPPIEATRLCAEAPGDTILASATVRMLAGRTNEVTFEPAGHRRLKGFPEPVETFAVGWTPLAEESAEVLGWPLPAPLRSVPKLTYVGRFEERTLLEETLAAAQEGERHLTLISGEPGIGKTRLATYAAHQAHARGFAVCWGTCSEDISAPYEPWIEVCSQLVDLLPQEVLGAHVERHRGELQRVAPALASRLPGLPAPQLSDSETERYMLFTAVVGLLAEVARRMPLCVVIDDLHWADAQSIALLKHVVRDVEGASLELIAAYRDSNLGNEHPLTAVLADLRAIPGAHRLALQGLTTGDVAHILQAVGGHDLDAEGLALADDVARETAGNPFFVGEIVRGLSESGAFAYDATAGQWRIERVAVLHLPESVRDIVERRVARLGGEAADTLKVASVIGAVFDLGLLAAAAESREEHVLDHLEAAVAASLLEESAEGIGEFHFAHGLINQTLYEGIGPTRRARLHHRVAVALEELGGGREERLPELAMHWRLATSAVDVRKAADYARRAGKLALKRLAPADAATLYRDALDLSTGGNEREQCEALIGLGEAQRQLGEAAYRETLLAASSLASEIGDPELAAEAALANSRGSYSVIGEVDTERVAAIERALELDDPPVPARRARLLALEAQEIEWTGEQQRRRDLADEALSLARGAGDARALGSVLLNAYYAYWSPETLAQAAAVADELAVSVDTIGDPALAFWSHIAQLNLAIEESDAGRAEVALELLGGTAAKLGQPILDWVAAYNRAGWGLMRIPMAAADELVEEAFRLGQRAGEPDAVFIYGAQLASVRSYSGRGEEVIGMLEQSVSTYPDLAVWRAAMAHVYCLLGRHDEAAAVVEQAAAKGFRDLPRDETTTTATALYADAAAQAGVPEAAAALYERIEPWAERAVWNGAVGFGHGRMWLGVLAAALGRHEEANAHFAHACRVQERAGLFLWSCYGRLCWAEALARRGEEARARAEALSALEVARAYGYGTFEGRAAAIAAGGEPVSGLRMPP